MATLIQIRRGTAAEWTSANPVLANGEIGFISDENKIKIGDGTTSFTSLNYLEAEAYVDSVALGTDTTGNYVETVIAGDGLSVSGEGTESASVTLTNTGVLSLTGTANEITVSASAGDITLSLPTSITVDVVGSVTGNADTASALSTARNISLGGDVSGSASFDGSSDITITATVADDSHDHTIANIDGLQTALDNNASSASAVASDLTDHENATTSVHGIADTSLLATKDYADNSASAAAAALVDSAPEALNTLNELAAALGDDANFSTTITNSLAEKLSIASASATYLTQTDAASLYDTIGSASAVASDLADHENATTNVHGIADTSLLATESYADSSASAAQSAAESYADSLAVNYDPAGSASAAQSAAESYADSLAVNYDAAGSASAVASDLTNHESATTNVHGITDTSELATKTYADNAGVTSLSGTASEIEVSASTGSVILSLPSTINADTTGNAATASALETSREISLAGDLSGSASFDGGSNITITAAVADDSHNHIISNVDGLQDELNLKAPLDSPAFTGTPTAPTASASANSTQIATTAFVQTNISNLINGAPGALDTLDELAAALGDDANFASTVTNSLAGKQPLDADLTAIAELSASATGFLKKDGDNLWSLDNSAYLTGNESISISGDATGSGTTSISLTLADSGVSASSYGSASSVGTFTVDSKGRLTSASDTPIAIAQSAVTNLTTDLSAKAPLASPTFTGTVVLPSTTSIGNVSSTELGYLDGVTSAIQTQINSKAGTSSPTFTGTVSASAISATSIVSGLSFRPGYTTTVTSGSLVTLTVSSTQNQFFTGSTNQSINLPVTSTLSLGHYYDIHNVSSATVTVRSSGSNTITSIPANSSARFTCILTSGTTAASWSSRIIGTSSYAGSGGSIVLSTSPTISNANLSGFPTATTASPGNNSTRIATTEYVDAAAAAAGPSLHPMFIIGGV